jgi:hypothetical protein
VRKNLADGDPVPLRKPGNKLADSVVEREFPSSCSSRIAAAVNCFEMEPMEYRISAAAGTAGELSVAMRALP